MLVKVIKIFIGFIVVVCLLFIAYLFRPLTDVDLLTFDWVVLGHDQCGLEGFWHFSAKPSLHGYQLKGNTIFNPENTQAIAVITRQYYAEGVVATIQVENIQTKQQCVYVDAYMSMIW